MNTFISAFPELVGKTVTISGWVYNFRSSGKIFFLQLRDGSGFVQAVASKNDLPADAWAACQQVTLETSVEITGVVKADKRSTTGVELGVTDVQLISVAQDWPIGKKEHGPEFLMDNRHLWLRAPSQWAIQRVRNTIINATYEFFSKHGFIKIDAPILTPTACEGTTELFNVDYFGDSAYLSQSGQLYLEAAIFSVGRAFDFGPVFRAEKSKTRRHLTEFWMMDAEAAFVDFEQNLEIQEQLVQYIVEQVLKRNLYELSLLERDVAPLKKIKAPFIRLTHAEAIQQLKKLGSDIGNRSDLGADDEALLTKQYDKPIFVTHYPTEVKAFYMKRDPQDSTRVLNADLLAPEGVGEVIGGSQRVDDEQELIRRMKEHGLDPQVYQWYVDLRKYGSVPHSGFGYGLERLVRWITGVHHIRETIPFPRMLNRMRP